MPTCSHMFSLCLPAEYKELKILFDSMSCLTCFASVCIFHQVLFMSKINSVFMIYQLLDFKHLQSFLLKSKHLTNDLMTMKAN